MRHCLTPLRLVLVLLCWWPLLAAAQSVPVPATLDFAGLHLRLTDGGRRAVQQKVDALRSHPASFQARVNLADAYFPIIERVLQEEAVPLDFRFLAIQESGLQGEAQSIHDAVGYWQFKRESAADFGVVMNDDVDERKHIVASTHAAAKYLKRNNIALHNWVNTLLSYNLGSGGVKAYTLPTDYDATEMEISEQTHPYVLTMLAHKLAYEPAVGHNPQPPLMLQEFPAPAGQPLSILATSLQVEPAELAKHNRWLLAATVPTDKIYTVLVPVTDPIQLTALAAQQKNATAGQLLNQPQPDPQNAEYVRVNGLKALIALPGETKESMARRAGLKLRRFMQFNDLFAFDNVVAGQPYFTQKKRDKAATEYHVAQPGESVATVSQKYGIRAKAIWNKNRMARNEVLRPGRVLWLQHTRPRDVAIEYSTTENTKALAAFERPVGTAPATAAPAPARPQPRTPAPVAAQPASPAATRVVGDVTEPTPEPEAATGLVTQPENATDATTENLNDLNPAAEADPATATEITGAAPAPPAQGLYTGRPAPKPLPASAPVADEPAPEPTPAPAVLPRTSPKPIATAPAEKPAPATPVAAAPAPRPAAPKPTAAPAAPATPAPPAAPAALPANGLHKVQPKETLYGVARLYNLRPADLIAWNDLPPNPSLQLGQTLRLTPPTAAATAAPAAPRPTAPAPTPATPAPAPAPKPTSTRPGIYQPKPAATSAPAATPAPTPAAAPAAPAASSPAAAPAATVRHTVGAGESMYAISRKYGVTIKQIMEWNGKPDFNVKPGEVLLIKPAKPE